jgi:glycosyltransferase involved in cell wall biosynthesis
LKFAEKYINVELTMIGGRKLEFLLKKIIQSSPDKHKVNLLGWLDRKEVIEYMKRCDVFLFPTFEGGGMVVLEAMSYGKPIICIDYGGPKDFVSDECEIKIPLTNRKQIINDLSEALDKLYNDNDLRLKLGKAARERVEDYYTWDKNAEWMNYNEVIESQLPIA